LEAAWWLPVAGTARRHLFEQWRSMQHPLRACSHNQLIVYFIMYWRSSDKDLSRSDRDPEKKKNIVRSTGPNENADEMTVGRGRSFSSPCYSPTLKDSRKKENLALRIGIRKAAFSTTGVQPIQKTIPSTCILRRFLDLGHKLVSIRWEKKRITGDRF